MRPPRTVSLFTEQVQSSQRASSFLVSILIHAAVIGLVFFVLMFAPRINMQVAAERYIVRRVDLDRTESEKQRAARNSSLYPGPRSIAQVANAQGSEAAPSSSRRQITQLTSALQTLLQPDIPLNKLIVKKTPLPALLLWSANKVKVKNITPPPPPEPSTADLKPSLDPPNKEENLSDLELSSAAFPTEAPMPLPAKTSPVVVHGPGPVEHVPETTSVRSTQTASVAVMSISDFNVAQGTVVLPPANETAAGSPTGALAPGTSGASSQPGKGDSSSKGMPGDTGHRQGNVGDRQGDAAGKSAPTGSGAVRAGTNSGGGKASPDPLSGRGDQGDDRSFVRITLPKDGKFGVVVVGSAIQDQYPETAGIWSGRMTYSVYLHVGLAKSWILQYSLPRAADAAAAGAVVRLDAPWPYYIVRPNLAPNAFDADALMIHGFLNQTGHFEALSVAFPPEYTQAQPLLDALQQWQFRPAAQNGQATRVEVLLVIPEVVE